MLKKEKGKRKRFKLRIRRRKLRIRGNLRSILNRKASFLLILKLKIFLTLKKTSDLLECKSRMLSLREKR